MHHSNLSKGLWSQLKMISKKIYCIIRSGLSLVHYLYEEMWRIHMNSLNEINLM